MSEKTNSLTKVSHTLRTTLCDWLFSNILNETKFQLLTEREKQKLYGDTFTNLSEMLTIMDIAGEGTESDILNIVLQHYQEEKDSFGGSSEYSKFQAYYQWLQNNKKPENKVENLELSGVLLLRIIENYGEKTDKATLFRCISSAKSIFSECLKIDPQRILSNYGFGISCLLHARTIDTQTELQTQTAYKLLLKSQEKMNGVMGRVAEFEAKEGKLPFGFYYQMARVLALLEDVCGCLSLLLKAKTSLEFPDLKHRVLSNSDFKKVISIEPELEVILSEDVNQTKLRLAFEEDVRKYRAKTGFGNSTILDRSITKSQMIRNALSTSTLNFLVDQRLPLTINLRDFFQPIITPQFHEAQQRLKERMQLYGVHAKREIPGDGNCQMHSLSDQLCGNLHHGKFIRKRLVRWLKSHATVTLSNGCTLKDFVHDQSWEEYCERMSREGEWGDHLTLIAAAEVFKSSIVIISSVLGDNFVIEVLPTFSIAENTIMLSHFAEFHYGSVLPVSN